jgi:hypothetical protein
LSSFSNPLTEFSPQLEFAATPLLELEDESGRGVFGESQELELASRLLEVVNDEQLDQFLSDLIRKGGTATGSVVAPSDRRAIKDVLKGAIYRILPMRSVEHGSTRHSSVGAQLSSGLSSLSGQVLGLELEGLSPEDREFEAIRQFVRFAGETVKNAGGDSMRTDPREMGHRAAADAAETFAPGLFADGHHVTNSRGHWILCRDKIILFGV